MWMKWKKNTEFKYSLVCIFISVIFLVWLIPAYTPVSNISGDMSSDTLPNAMMFIILACGVFMLIKSVFFARSEAGGGTPDGAAGVPWRRLLLVLACVLGYLLAFNWVGFYVTTLAALPLTVRYFNRGLSWKKILLSSAVLLIFIYALFEVGLSVKMPRGFLF